MKSLIIFTLLFFAAPSWAGQDNPMQAKWDSLSPEQKQNVLAAYEKWKSEPKQRQEQLLENYRRFLSMSPAKRAEIARKWEKFNSLPDKEKKALLSKYGKWKELSPERKEELRRKYSRERELPERGSRGGRERDSGRGGGRR